MLEERLGSIDRRTNSGTGGIGGKTFGAFKGTDVTNVWKEEIRGSISPYESVALVLSLRSWPTNSSARRGDNTCMRDSSVEFEDAVY
jgi:hypothetical protein